MEIRRFGPGHRRPDGPPGSRGVTGQVIHDGEEAIIAELAFQRYAMIAPHSNPNLCLFLVISGGGFVQVGDERARVNHGEAVVWPGDIAHGAYTDGAEMRAIVVELRQEGADRSVLDGVASRILESGELPPSQKTPTTEPEDDRGRDTRAAGSGASPGVGASAGTTTTGPGSGPGTGERTPPVAGRSSAGGPATGRLADRTVGRDEYDTSTGEPW